MQIDLLYVTPMISGEWLKACSAACCSLKAVDFLQESHHYLMTPMGSLGIPLT